MSRRAAIIATLIERRFIARQTGNEGRERSDVFVTVYCLRKRGFKITTEPGVGYRLTAKEAHRLAADPRTQATLAACAPTVSIVATISRDSVRVLDELAQERGTTRAALAALCLERGIDGELAT